MTMLTQLHHIIYSGWTISQYFGAETYPTFFPLILDFFFTERSNSLTTNDIQIY